MLQLLGPKDYCTDDILTVFEQYWIIFRSYPQIALLSIVPASRADM